MRTSVVALMCLVVLSGCSGLDEYHPSAKKDRTSKAQGGNANASGVTVDPAPSAGASVTAGAGAAGTAGGLAGGGAQSNVGGETMGGIAAGAGGSASNDSLSNSGGVSGGTTSTGENLSGGTTTTGDNLLDGTTTTGGTPGTTSEPSAVMFKCANLLSAAGASGQPKPSATVGGLKVLDWAGFKAAVSFTFDDNNATQVANMTALKATGARMTFFITSSWSNASADAFKTASAEGHEIGNHTSTHSSAGDVTDAQACQTFVSTTYGVTPFTMAAPYGNTSWAEPAQQLFIANRGVNDGLIGPRDATDAFNLPAYLPPTDASAAVMDSAVEEARTAGKWKIFCVHGFDSSNGTWQPVAISDMTTTMSNAVTSGDLWVDTMGNIAAYWLGQKAIPESATTSATWSLPANFPPNMCVRVTTTGGTVKQNGVEVPWNEHGYYEISLDARSVSVE